MTDPPRAELEAQTWRAVRALVMDRYDRRKEVCDALGMSFIRAKALRKLAEAPLTMRELAAGLGTDAPYTTLVVDDLERRGLVVRSAHPTDRRSKIVTATPDGTAAAARAEDILNEPPQPVRQLDAADLAALNRIVTTLLDAGEGAIPDEGTAA
ncbi:MarR family transcriptional regulator [Rugosimonospora acidiphila]|uniref:MarR family transcriptional regulator n=1 Tax=Rugosimonospora acidiphila TaxID=556531 RepID=A0ABP9RI19_9ACTN